MTILLDNGHSIDTPGKRSPDGSFLEYKYSRIIAGRIVTLLTSDGLDARLLTPETTDTPLRTRCERANALCKTLGAQNVILLSIHVNAAGNGSKWTTATGWSAYTSLGNTRADLLATYLYKAAAKYLPHFPLRTDYRDSDPDLEENFYILRHTLCPAVLTENLFMDNRQDVQFLQSHSGLEAITDLHLEGIREYLSH